MNIAAALVALLLVPFSGSHPEPEHPVVAAWGFHGHQIAARVATEGLPGEMPDFFREAAHQLVWLNPEPDRWRDRAEQEADPALGGHYNPNHYVNFEGVPDEVWEARDRYAYVDSLRAAGIDGNIPGFLPFAIVEKTQRLRNGFRRWREAESPEERRWIEARIVNDAGILGHYVTDGSNPHHTTIHFNGWDRNTPNPRGFTTDRTFHSRFESQFVGARVSLDDLRRAELGAPRVIADLREGALDHLRHANSHVVQLYELEQQETFGPGTESAEHHAFAVDRLADGARTLRNLWWTAWITSADEDA